ncbi:MAG: DUF4105 domain-containing protein [Granulosicoccus sp.]|nr:DUF4105 domain-containing protein [Granulosicoccus sp.]
MHSLIVPRRLLSLTLYLLIISHSAAAHATGADWLTASNRGEYDLAVTLADQSTADKRLQNLLAKARTLELADTSQWRSFIHYKPTVGNGWLSQVDAPHFFLSERGKQSPQAELDATLAAFFSEQAKAPLRLTAYCRFVARRIWLTEQLQEAVAALPKAECPEFQRYHEFLKAHQLTLVFPTAHPNSPSSAFGHTLLRIDKKDQRVESRLLNMSINFAAEVPEDVSSTAYAIKGLAGGFQGKYRLLPYHIKLREYGQIENRDTWEYPLKLSQRQVDLVLRHAYEMLISHFDYYFFSENCSYHLLSLIEVAFPDQPLTDDFGLWTIPVDTIRALDERNLISEGEFVPSSVRTLKARRAGLSPELSALSLAGLNSGLNEISEQLDALDSEPQAAVLDLLADYERYSRLKMNRSAQGTSETERQILSRRSKLRVISQAPTVEAPEAPPERGHGTSRLGLSYRSIEQGADQLELSYRPAYHDFQDPSAAYGSNAAIELGLLSMGYEQQTERFFLRRFTLVSIESIEPRGPVFKPVSWHTTLQWDRATANSRHEFTFNVGAGVAYQSSRRAPVFFAFGESDWVDAPAFKQRRHLRLGVSFGLHWEPFTGPRSGRIRSGIEYQFRRQIGSDYEQSNGRAWTGIALNKNLSLNLDARLNKQSEVELLRRVGLELRTYF